MPSPSPDWIRSASTSCPWRPHVAEKLHAYVRIYHGDRPSTRTKDLIDLVLIAELFALDAHELASAIDATFSQREMGACPDGVAEATD